MEFVDPNAEELWVSSRISSAFIAFELSFPLKSALPLWKMQFPDCHAISTD